MTTEAPNQPPTVIRFGEPGFPTVTENGQAEPYILTVEGWCYALGMEIAPDGLSAHVVYRLQDWGHGTPE